MKKYSQMNVVKVLKKGGKSKYVNLMENNIVKKKYDRRIPEHVTAYNHEIQVLKYLESKGCPFVPRIVCAIPHKYTIFMTYCGTQPHDNRITQQKISTLAKTLHNDFQVVRLEDNKITYKIHPKNCCWEKGKYFLIDFGSPLWNIVK